MSDETDYRESYRDVSVHKMMLTDVVRTEAYERAIQRIVRPGMTVMDFGCGTGILSIFASRAGATAVNAVDRSGFIGVAREIARVNGIENIRFFHNDHKSLELSEKQDLIISEWMGHFIFFEAMLEPLLHLRDRYLKEDGVMVPDKITFRAGFVTDESFFEELAFFRQTPYGVDFSPIKDTPLFQTHLECFIPSQVSETVVELGEMDMYTVKQTPDLLEGVVTPLKAETVYGLAGWFDARLTGDIHIPTGPNDPPTHWNQMFLPFKEPLDLSPEREVSVRIRPPSTFEDAWNWTVSDGETLIQMNDFYPFEDVTKPGLLGEK